MSENKKVLITAASVNAAGRFADRGDIIEVTPSVAQALFNEGQATGNEEAIAKREAELAAAAPETEKAAAKPKTQKASAKPAAE